MKKRVLVTGGAGFLGSHLCERLVAQGHDVLCVDNYSTGTHRNVEALLGGPAFEVIRHDVTLPLYVEVDEVFNLACPASPVHYCRDPIQTTKTTVIGAMNMLGLAKRLHARILQASTCDVSEDSQIGEQVHDHGTSSHLSTPGTCYRDGNRCAETLCFDYKRQHNISVRIARILDSYGPRMHPDNGHLVSDLIIRALNNDPITIAGSGFQSKSLCYVDDIIDGLMRLMEIDDDIDEPVTFGNHVEVSVLELAHIIVSLTGSRSKVEFLSVMREGPARYPDVGLASKTLGWSPQVQLQDGLSRTISYYDALMSRPGESRKLRPDVAA